MLIQCFFGDIILIGNLSRILKAYLRTVRRVSHASFFTFCLFLGVNCPSSIWHYNRLECTPDIFATRGTNDATWMETSNRAASCPQRIASCCLFVTHSLPYSCVVLTKPHGFDFRHFSRISLGGSSCASIFGQYWSKRKSNEGDLVDFNLFSPSTSLHVFFNSHLIFVGVSDRNWNTSLAALIEVRTKVQFNSEFGQSLGINQRVDTFARISVSQF